MLKKIFTGFVITGAVIYFGTKYYFEFRAKKNCPDIEDEFSDLLE